MVELVPFAFEERLVRAVWREGEPWFVGIDVCACLGLAKPHTTLDLLDDDEKGPHTVGTPGGDQTMIIVSEPGVYRLVFRSRKPEAERFKRWLAHDVLPQLRKTGRFAAPEPTAEPSDSLLHRLQLIREARSLFGRERAGKLWRQLGLPDVPPPPPTALDEARQALRHLLDSLLADERSVRDALSLALDDDEEARLLLIGAGIRALPERDAFIVANRHRSLAALLEGTEWRAPLAFMRVLRRLPGASAAGPTRFGDWQWRGTLLPADLLDE